MAPLRLTVAVLLLALSACSTTRVVRLDTGQGEPLVHIPRTDGEAPVRLEREEFARAVATTVRQWRPSANPEKTARELFGVPPRSGWYGYTQREGVVPLDGQPPASQWAEVARESRKSTCASAQTSEDLGTARRR